MDSTLSDQQATSWLLGSALGIFVFSILILWGAVWKAIAMWKAARRGDTAWYVVLLLLNTLGILEIIYIFAVAKESSPVKAKPVVSEKPEVSEKSDAPETKEEEKQEK